jgi:K+ transporter
MDAAQSADVTVSNQRKRIVPAESAVRASGVFRIPAGRVIELGARVPV